jgi:competence protein ComEA
VLLQQEITMRLSYLLPILGLLASPLSAQTPTPGAQAPAVKVAPATAAKAEKSSSTSTSAPASSLIDINTAPKDQLDALPQIGSTRADAIIKGRPYKAKSDLVEKKIIPQGAYDAIKNRIVARQKS